MQKRKVIRQTLSEIIRENIFIGNKKSEIKKSIKTISRTLRELGENEETIRKGVINRLNNIYNQTRRVILNPISGKKEEAWYLHNIIENFLVYEHNRRLKQRIIISSDTAQKLRITGYEFKHIPYILVSEDEKNTKKILAARTKHNLKVKLEKQYILPELIRKKTSEWNLNIVGAPKAWNKSIGEDVRVGVADTGADYNHEEISHCFETNKGYNFINNTDDPFDDEGHGTHVSGIIGGKNVGVAPGCTLYALKFLDEYGSGYESDFIRAAEWAIEYELDVLNGSFGSSQYSEAEKAICQALQEHGIVFAAAAGNNGTSQYSYPASYESVMSVAAIDSNKKKASFSQYNEQVSISSPGVRIKSCIPGGKYASYSGTSMATPHVSGGLALVITKNNPRNIIEESAEYLGRSDYYGKGLLRCDKAV